MYNIIILIPLTSYINTKGFLKAWANHSLQALTVSFCQIHISCRSSNHGRLPWWLRWQRICLQCGRPGFDLWAGKIPWRREWLPTPVFLPGEFHGQGTLVGYSSWGHKELDTTEWLTLLLSLYFQS